MIMPTNELTIDFARVKKLNPHLFEIEELIGSILQIVSILTGVIVLVGMLSRGRLEYGVEAFIIVYCLHAFIYAKYLLRDKNKYQSNFGHRPIKSIAEANSSPVGPNNGHRNPSASQTAPSAVQSPDIEIDDYFDRELTTIISDLLDLETDKPFMYLGSQVFASRSISEACQRLGINAKDLHQLSSSWLQKYSQPSLASQQILAEALVYGFKVARQAGYEYYGVEALFLGTLYNYIPEASRSLGIETESIAALLVWKKMRHERENFLHKLLREQLISPVSKVNSSLTSVFSPTIEAYCDDLSFSTSRSVRQRGTVNNLKLSLRTEQLSRLIAVLNTDEALALITGPTGAGKTTLVNSLIISILAEVVPKNLLEKRVMQLNLSKVLGQENPADITKIMEQIFSELRRAGNIILLIDDLDQLLAVREDLRGEITALLAAQIKEVAVKLVAVVNEDSYEKYLSNLPLLTSSFSLIELSAASRALTEQMLLDELIPLERTHKVRVDYQALKKLVSLSEKTDLIKVLPDKALDNLSACVQEARRDGLGVLGVAEVENYFSKKTGAPMGLPKSRIERESIINLGERLAERVVGQSEAIRQVAIVLQRARAGLNNSHKPQASFLFYGPTGVGKTHLAKTIADLYYGKAELVLRLDMSEFHEDQNLGRLLGQTIGEDYQEGILTEFVQKHPFCLILLDEIEKANPKVLDLFLQVLDNAALLSGKGQKVDFSGCIIVATSNADPLGFRPEFLNRFDAVIKFAPLQSVHAEEIVRKLLWEKKQELAEKGVEFVFDDGLVSQITREGFEQTYGARSLKRAVQERVEGKAAQLLLSGKLKSGDVFQL